MISIANIIIKISKTSVVSDNQIHETLESAASGLLTGHVLSRAADNVPTSHILCVENVWVDGPHGGPFPTMAQGDAVRRLREIHGEETSLIFSPNAYQGTHLRAYGLVEMTWAITATQTRRVCIRPDGVALDFEPASI